MGAFVSEVRRCKNMEELRELERIVPALSKAIMDVNSELVLNERARKDLLRRKCQLMQNLEIAKYNIQLSKEVD